MNLNSYLPLPFNKALTITVLNGATDVKQGESTGLVLQEGLKHGALIKVIVLSNNPQVSETVESVIGYALCDESTVNTSAAIDFLHTCVVDAAA